MNEKALAVILAVLTTVLYAFLLTLWMS